MKGDPTRWRLTPRDHRRLDKELKVLGSVLKENRDITVQALRSFITVALSDGISIQDICRTTGASYPTVHRHMLDLGKVTRKGKSGPELIEARGSPDNNYYKLYYLTPKGRNIVNHVLAIIGHKKT